MTTTTPGRPRSFDDETVLDAAVDLFWERGYKETSTRDLERALGLSQSSLYNAFGSKQALLLAAIDRYETAVKRDLLDHLAAGGGIGAVDRFLEALAGWLAGSGMRGCLVVSLMTTAREDPAIAARVAAYRGAIRDALCAALDGTAPRAEVQARADLVLAASFGVHAIARAAPAEEVMRIIESIRHQVRTWD